jgi:Tfp pilus assembly protein PilO
MRFTQADRLWLIGGAVGALALVAIAWFLLVSPQNAETDGLRDQQAATETQVAALHHRLSELSTESGNLPQYRAELQKARQALPTTADLSGFLRELQSAGDASGVQVTAMSAAPPTDITGAGAGVSALSVSVTASGSADALTAFVAQVQQVQPRAALVDSVRTSVNGTDSAVLLTLTLRVFVAASGR